jgi:hypothetical protein
MKLFFNDTSIGQEKEQKTKGKAGGRRAASGRNEKAEGPACGLNFYDQIL